MNTLQYDVFNLIVKVGKDRRRDLIILERSYPYLKVVLEFSKEISFQKLEMNSKVMAQGEGQ